MTEIAAWCSIAIGFLMPAIALTRFTPVAEISGPFAFWTLAPHLALALLAVGIRLWARRPHPIYALLATSLPLTAASCFMHLQDALYSRPGDSGCMSMMFYGSPGLGVVVLVWFALACLVTYSVAQIRHTL